jgi:hypothetical protein
VGRTDRAVPGNDGGSMLPVKYPSVTSSGSSRLHHLHHGGTGHDVGAVRGPPRGPSATPHRSAYAHLTNDAQASPQPAEAAEGAGWTAGSTVARLRAWAEAARQVLSCAGPRTRRVHAPQRTAQAPLAPTSRSVEDVIASVLRREADAREHGVGALGDAHNSSGPGGAPRGAVTAKWCTEWDGASVAELRARWIASRTGDGDFYGTKGFEYRLRADGAPTEAFGRVVRNYIRPYNGRGYFSGACSVAIPRSIMHGPPLVQA